MIVRESLDFEREGSPLKRLNIGILTWEKLKPGDILQNKRNVYPVMSRLFFNANEDTGDNIRPEKYWIIKTIRSDNTWDGNPGLEIELVWAGIFRHALSMSERIKQPGDLASKNLPNSYTSNKSIEEWNDWFKIIQPKEYDLEESVNFERGIEPKVSMDIGNKWTRIKPGDIIECIKEVIVEGRGSGEFLTFRDYIPGAYLGGSDYYFIPGNFGVIKNVVDLQEVGLRINLLPYETREEAERVDIKKSTIALYSATKGTAPIDVWAKYFKVL
jgi:hypothetical protein